MRRARAVLLGAAALLVALGACGGEEEPAYVSGVALEAEAVAPMRTGEPLRWRVTVVTDGSTSALHFPDGQTAELTLRDGDEVVYRWSEELVFTQGRRTLELTAARTDVLLDDGTFDVPAGEYEATVALTSREAVEPVVRPVRVRR